MHFRHSNWKKIINESSPLGIISRLFGFNVTQFDENEYDDKNGNTYTHTTAHTYTHIFVVTCCTNRSGCGYTLKIYTHISHFNVITTIQFNQIETLRTVLIDANAQDHWINARNVYRDSHPDLGNIKQVVVVVVVSFQSCTILSTENRNSWIDNEEGGIGCRRLGFE